MGAELGWWRRAARAALGGLLALLAVGCAGSPAGLDVDRRPVATTPATAASKPAGSDRFGMMMRLGDAAGRSGDWAAAANLYRQAVDADPNNPRARVALGEALVAVGSPGAAEQAFQEALRLAPEDRGAAHGYARVLIELGRPEAAAARYAALVEADPSDVRAINGLGVAQDLAGRHEAAQATYRKGLVRDPHDLTLRNNLGLSLALSAKPKEAIPILHRVASDPGATARNRQNLALAYGLAGDAASAERVARLDLDEDAVRDNLAFYAEVRRRHGAPPVGAPGPAFKSAPPAVPTTPDGAGRATGPSPDVRADTEPARPAPSVVQPIVTKPDARSLTRPTGEGTTAVADSVPAAETAAADADAGADAAGPDLGAIAVAGQDLQLGSNLGKRWFLELGEYADGRRAVAAWRDLRRRHPGMLSGLNRLAGIERGRQPLLVGPLATGAEARALCRRLKGGGEACRAVLL